MRFKRKIDGVLNSRGSSLVLTVILIAVVSVLLVGTHTAVVSYAERINATYYENQAYLTARSVATAIAEEINARGENEKTEINNRIEAFKEEEKDRAQAAKDNNLAYEPDPDDIQAELRECMKPWDPLLRTIYDMTSGDSLMLDELSFTNAGFRAGIMKASISKLVESDETVHYTITAETTIDDKKESVSLELVMSEDEDKSSVTTDTIVKNESETGGGTEGEAGGSGTVTGGISFESNSTGKI